MARADDVVIAGDARGVRRVRLADYLDAGLAERAEREANAWVKSLRSVPVEGLPVRERFTHRGDSLWWFAELYLHKMQVANHVFRTLLALDALVEREHPAQLGAAGSNPYVRVLARRVAERDGIAWIGGGRRRLCLAQIGHTQPRHDGDRHRPSQTRHCRLLREELRAVW